MVKSEKFCEEKSKKKENTSDKIKGKTAPRKSHLDINIVFLWYFYTVLFLTNNFTLPTQILNAFTLIF